jgi:hypothetical protein
MNNTIPADSRNKETHPPSTAVSPSTLLVIGEEFLNSRDVLRVALDQFKGRRTVDIRKHYKREDGTVAPTRKGLTLSIDRLPALAELITAALDRARADGLLPAVSP